MKDRRGWSTLSTRELGLAERYVNEAARILCRSERLLGEAELFLGFAPASQLNEQLGAAPQNKSERPLQLKGAIPLLRSDHEGQRSGEMTSHSKTVGLSAGRVGHAKSVALEAKCSMRQSVESPRLIRMAHHAQRSPPAAPGISESAGIFQFFIDIHGVAKMNVRSPNPSCKTFGGTHGPQNIRRALEVTAPAVGGEECGEETKSVRVPALPPERHGFAGGGIEREPLARDRASVAFRRGVPPDGISKSFDLAGRVAETERYLRTSPPIRRGL